MDTKKLEAWANQLLDTGKRNNLINFKDTKTSTVEVVVPDIEKIFARIESSHEFEVIDPKLSDEEDENITISNQPIDEGDTLEELRDDEVKKINYIQHNQTKVKNQNQILIYNKDANANTVLKKIDKKTKTVIEETGVNVLYMAFGFVHWSESENSKYIYRAPIILAPISLKNSSSIEPYYIQMSEDDIIINPTFDYLIKAQYGISLPQYESGDLATYFEEIANLVSKLGWTVSSVCKIGIFSFLKINMYEDIMNNQEKILKNLNIRKILGEEVGTDSEDFDPDNTELSNELVELHNVVDADSSQLEAIKKAKAGVSFVLQGPPGTGKSQTITNIIAECLSDNKKVLFVSEKQAALNVVYGKLKNAGLEEFCLELHSYKANKKDVIDELCHTLRRPLYTLSSRANMEIEQKIEAQKELDDYERELHMVRNGINKSLYQLYDAYSIERNAPDIEYVIQNIKELSESDIHENYKILQQYAGFAPTIGKDYRKNVWFGCTLNDSSHETMVMLKKKLGKSQDAFSKLSQIVADISSEYELDIDSYNKCNIWNPVLLMLSQSSFITPALMNTSCINESLSIAHELMTLSDGLKNIRDRILSEYDREILDFDSELEIKRLTRQYNNQMTRLFNKEYKQFISDVRINRKSGAKVEYEEAIRIMKLVSEYKSVIYDYNENESIIQKYIGPGYKGFDTNWEVLISQITYIKQLLDRGFNFGRIAYLSDSEYEECKSKLKLCSTKINEITSDNGEDIDYINGIFDSRLFEAKTRPISIVLTKLDTCTKDIDGLYNWIGFKKVITLLIHRNLGGFINKCIDDNIPSDEVPSTYRKLFYKQWIDSIIFNSQNSLSSFNRIAHDKAVDVFKEKDSLQFEINKAQIKSMLSSKRPSINMLAAGSQLSILMREGEKRRKQKSIRRLLEETGELVQQIKPCFLMSPLSVSTYLSSSSINFDVVIFDEASQIFPQDALGAIYRGKQVIVVGDSMQMPPTNFFTSSMEVDSDEETGDVTDFESILDVCSTSMPQIRLKWHYRSRYEQLITFSNKNFYDNDLVTFPSSKNNAEGIGVDYFFMDGEYETRAGRNPREAEGIVELIYENIKLFPNRSLGVVAFNIRQQELIENYLEKYKLEHPGDESFFSQDKPEPFFIKNLETVQGDERDTIIFSTVYGRNAQGKILQNFGPINRVGGERRLNVAITRAKHNVQIVSSMHASDITINNDSPLGKRLFREYLDYAEHGTIALDRTINVNSFEEFDSEFEKEVYDFIRANGYCADTQVGVSNFKIDIGLRKNETSDYVLAIECDGATYHSSRNARDRDRLRQSILEGMGWKFYRIWSTDWFRNTSVEKKSLLEACKAALESEQSEIDSNDDTKAEDLHFEKTHNAKKLVFPVYEKYDFSKLYEKYLTHTEMICEIACLEAPISQEWLLKRMVHIYDQSKVTSTVKRKFSYNVADIGRYGYEARGEFIYQKGNNSYVMRVPASAGDRRDIKYIAPEELASGMLVYLRQNISADKEGLFTAIIKELGYQKLTSAASARLEEALSLLSGFVRLEGSLITLKS